MTETTSIGIQSVGDNVNWKYLNEERVDDPIITILMKEAKMLFIDNKINIKNNNDQILLKLCIEYYNKYLKDNKINSIIKLEYNIDKQDNNNLKDNNNNDNDNNDKKDKKKIKQNKHGMKQEVTKKDLMLQKIAEDNVKKDMNDFIKTLVINENMPHINKKNIESLFVILNWGIYLIENSKKIFDNKIYINCSISLYRAIYEVDFLTETLKKEMMKVVLKLEDIIYLRCINDNYIFKLLMDNLILLIDSHWDLMKPKSVCLYNEQKDIISLVTENLNKKMLIFYEMPPANGKTVLSAILAKIISNKNDKKHKRKTLLYICYNTIVRNEIAKLCITHSLDVKYWLAVTMPDKETGKIKPFLKPYKNCYPDWNKKRTPKEQEKYDKLKVNRYNDDIFEQWKFYLNETRLLSEQYFDVKDYTNADNLPEMIISDLDSAYTLLSTFPDTFITYFDEAFASSNLEITSKIMSVLGHTVLVSATLASPEEIPTVINDFKTRHGHDNYDFLKIIKSTKQHISSTFIEENGYIFAPHDFVTNLDDLKLFLTNIDKPLIRRGYSPEVVFNISKVINDDLPINLKFKSYFDKLGKISHESLRDYIFDILKYIDNTMSNTLLEKILSIKTLKIPDMNINNIFTTSAYHYCNNKTLHVSTVEGFNMQIEDMSKTLLLDAPKINDVLNIYTKEYNEIKKSIENLDRNGNKDSDYERTKLYRNMDNLKLKFSSECIVNSLSHSQKYGTDKFITNYNTDVFAKKDDLDIYNDTRTKLLFSGIGIYEPECYSNIQMNYFLRKKDAFKFILSTPSIVYGTNISLSIIDINKSFLKDSTKNTLYQLIGRAGRKGRSHSATIIFRDNEMLKMILNTDVKNIDADLIEYNYNKLLSNK